MEELRALPFSIIGTGMDNAVCSSGVADPKINCSTWTFTGASPAEPIPHGSLSRTATSGSGTANLTNDGLDPLYTNQSINGIVPRNVRIKSVNKTSYTIRSYVSKGTSTEVYRVSVYVSFPNARKPGGVETISNQSLVYSQGGCVSSATHPFGAPCQPFFYGLATTGIGSIFATPNDPDTTGISGVDGTTMQRTQVEVTEATSSFQTEQITAVSGRTRASGSKIIGDAGGDLLSGNMVATGKVDDDPGSVSPVTSNGSVSQGTVSRIQLGPDDTTSSTSRQVHSNASDGDTGNYVVTASALSAHNCIDFTGTTAALNTGLPCATSGARQMGTSVISFRLRDGGIYLANDAFGRNTELATIEVAPGVRKSFTARYINGTLGHCTSTNGAGCSYSAAQRSFGTVTFAKLPTLFTSSSTPSYLARLTNYSDKATAERGVATSTATAVRLPANGTGTPTLDVWDGNPSGALPGGTSATGDLYSHFTTWSGSTTALTIPTVDLTNGDWRIRLVPQLSMGGLTTASDGPADCSTLCTTSANIGSPLSGTVEYNVWYKGSQLVDLNLAIDLGTLTAESQYKKAPSAG